MKTQTQTYTNNNASAFQTISGDAPYRAKSKVNTGLSRSKSAAKIKKKGEDQQEPRYRLDLSPEERIKDDLQRKINN